MSRRSRRNRPTMQETHNEVSTSNFTNEQMVKVVQESFDWMIKRAQEDVTWLKLAANSRAASTLPREVKLEWCRTSYLTDSFAKRSVQVPSEFAFGSGVNGPIGRIGVDVATEDEAPLQLLRSFWHSKLNQKLMFSLPMLLLRSAQLLVDGSAFFKMFPDQPNGKPMQIRRYPTGLVDHIVSHPEDSSRPMYYACKVVEREFDENSANYLDHGTWHWEYVRDCSNTDENDDPLYAQLAGNLREYNNDEVFMLHISINNIEDCEFGEPDIITSLKWLAGNKMISEDQATISRASAALMNILQTKTTGQNALAGLQQQIESTTSDGSTVASPRPPMPGGVNIMSDGLEMKSNRVTTQAQDAWQNSRLMRIPAAAGVGLALHFLADPENASLATTTSMELPILRHLEAYQSIWRSAYREMCDFALTWAGYDPEEVLYDIPMPQILESDIAKVAAAIIDGEASGFLTLDQAAQRFMEVLNLDNIPDRLKELKQELEQKAKQAEEELSQQLETIDQATQAPLPPTETSGLPGVNTPPGNKSRHAQPEPNPTKKYPDQQT